MASPATGCNIGCVSFFLSAKRSTKSLLTHAKSEPTYLAFRRRGEIMSDVKKKRTSEAKVRLCKVGKYFFHFRRSANERRYPRAVPLYKKRFCVIAISGCSPLKFAQRNR